MLYISTKELSVNNEIRAVQIRVIDDSGNQLGVMKTRDALNMAQEKGLDLVEIAPTAEIPVCRIMDYGKYKFEKAKKEKEAKKRQVVVEIKEVQLSCSIDTHDFNTRVNQAKKFIDAGNKVKVSLEFAKGREMAHMERGYQMLEKFEQSCVDFSIVEKRPVREGRRITMFIGPKKVVVNNVSGKDAGKRESAVKAENVGNNSNNSADLNSKEIKAEVKSGSDTEINEKN